MDDAELLAEVRSIRDDLSDYLPADDETLPRIDDLISRLEALAASRVIHKCGWCMADAVRRAEWSDVADGARREGHACGDHARLLLQWAMGLPLDDGSGS